MIHTECPKCKIKLEIDECDTTPGCREMEEVFCPECRQEVTKVRTSGIPYVRVIKKE